MGPPVVPVTATGGCGPGRGIVTDHRPHFRADDDTPATGVRLHTHVAEDHLTGS
ncbi:hypothetical protein ACGF1Z_01875 [Streptomyces sp. NPDC048018]|uniref:hypothetical protein n=1 Tax=Streptomyces sp. NPDC048018 TaxID=3365499 RepID=UPI003724B991